MHLDIFLFANHSKMYGFHQTSPWLVSYISPGQKSACTTACMCSQACLCSKTSMCAHMCLQTHMCSKTCMGACIYALVCAPQNCMCTIFFFFNNYRLCPSGHTNPHPPSKSPSKGGPLLFSSGAKNAHLSAHMCYKTCMSHRMCYQSCMCTGLCACLCSKTFMLAHMCSPHLVCKKLDGVGPIDNRPSTH